MSSLTPSPGPTLAHKYSTRADPAGGRFPRWGQTLRVLLPPGTAVDDAMLHVHVVHAVSEDGTVLLIGWATLRLCNMLEDNHGYSGGGRANEWSLQLRRPSGRPQGKVHVKLVVKEMRYCAPPAAYGVPPPPASWDYTAPPPSYGQVENFGGMLTGFAVGAAAGVAGVLAGLALAKGVDNLVYKITDVAEKPKELLASDDDAEAAEDEGAEDASDDDAEAEDAYALTSEDASEDEEDPASEIDLAYGDDGGGDNSGDDGSGDN